MKMGKIFSKTAKNFSIIRKQVPSWVKDEDSILQMNIRSRVKRYPKEKYRQMENKLHGEFVN